MTDGKNITIKENVYIGENVILEDDVYIDFGTIIRNNVLVKKGTYIGAGCILGEYTSEFFINRNAENYPLIIGKKSIIRSGCIIYGKCQIGDYFQTGHHVTIREGTIIGEHSRVGTFSDIQHDCLIGNYVSLHSSVFLGEETQIDDYAWLFPGVTVTNDPTPPSNVIKGVHICSFASIGAKSILLPGVTIKEHSLIGAGAVVTKNVHEKTVVVGNPAREVAKVNDIRNKDTGEKAYPWPEHFGRGMPWNDIGFEEWGKRTKE